MVAKAPLTTRHVSAARDIRVSEYFFAGLKGTKPSDFSGAAPADCAAARTAASTGSLPPSLLAAAPSARISASPKPKKARAAST